MLQPVAPLGGDFSMARPTVAQLQALNLISIGRYAANDSRGLSKPERDRYFLGALSVWLFAEGDVGQMLRGAAGGRQDVDYYNRIADGLEWPATRPLFFACDTDPGNQDLDHNGRFGLDAGDFPLEAGYLAEVQHGRPVGVYGGAGMCQAMLDAGLAQFACVSNAAYWDHGHTAPGSHLHQAGPLLGGSLDAQFLLKPDWGAWHPDQSHTLPPTEDDMGLTADDRQFISNECYNLGERTKAVLTAQHAEVMGQLNPNADPATSLRALAEQAKNGGKAVATKVGADPASFD